jgi:hypothetical protein
MLVRGVSTLSASTAFDGVSYRRFASGNNLLDCTAQAESAPDKAMIVPVDLRSWEKGSPHRQLDEWKDECG